MEGAAWCEFEWVLLLAAVVLPLVPNPPASGGTGGELQLSSTCKDVPLILRWGGRGPARWCVQPADDAGKGGVVASPSIEAGTVAARAVNEGSGGIISSSRQGPSVLASILQPPPPVPASTVWDAPLSSWREVSRPIPQFQASRVEESGIVPWKSSRASSLLRCSRSSERSSESETWPEPSMMPPTSSCPDCSGKLSRLLLRGFWQGLSSSTSPSGSSATPAKGRWSEGKSAVSSW
mmetsp:Transcript_81859/g.171226  ORF Transcript_81859/g.171226 Transcript_81859/m.171226 type:complete len:236 (+) Transcript_81859:1337-2044(+)